MKKILSVFLLLVMSTLLIACNSKTPKITSTVKEISRFNDLNLEITSEDFLKSGFEIGDSVNVEFSNGRSHTDVPFYDNYYGNQGNLIVLAYEKNLIISRVSAGYTNLYPMDAGEDVTITINEKGKYKELSELYYLRSPKEKYDDQSDEEFGNGRMITVGEIKSNRIYRSGSPVDPNYNRIDIVSKFIEDNSINTIINLANSEDEVAGFDYKTEIIEKMITDGSIKFETMSANYKSDSDREKTANVIRDIGNCKPPYLIHCSLGQDRTGFVSALVEAMCGASYDEITKDYMKTYDNLYKFTKDSNPKKYDLILERVDDMLIEITGDSNPSELSSSAISEKTTEYLKNLGLSEEEIFKAKTVLCS